MDTSTENLLERFGKAFNALDLDATRECVTDDFVWIFYEGPDSPDGQVLRGVEAACGAVAERAARLAGPIEFSESHHYQCDNKVFVTYRARGAFRDEGRFDVRAVDIYTIRDGKLASKDTYWKKIRHVQE